jgi:hypothetical protein|eukprot:1034694-Prymnesium_polylepis.1
MFTAGTKTVSRGERGALPDEERKVLAFLRSNFGDHELGQSVLPAIDVDETPQPLLPPGWEQRREEKSGRIFFVDHNTCVGGAPRAAAAGCCCCCWLLLMLAAAAAGCC